MYKIVILMSVLVLVTSGNLSSQTSVTAQAFAEVIETLTVTETDQLYFGRFSTEIGGGQIIITPDGVRSAQGSVILVESPHSPGRFRLSGAPGASFTIQLPQSSSVLVHTNGGHTLIVDDWMSYPSAVGSNTILTNGLQIISIGAILKIGSVEQNPVGIYTGTYQLTFAYD